MLSEFRKASGGIQWSKITPRESLNHSSSLDSCDSRSGSNSSRKDKTGGPFSTAGMFGQASLNKNSDRGVDSAINTSHFPTPFGSRLPLYEDSTFQLCVLQKQSSSRAMSSYMHHILTQLPHHLSHQALQPQDGHHEHPGAQCTPGGGGLSGRLAEQSPLTAGTFPLSTSAWWKTRQMNGARKWSQRDGSID